MAEPNDANREHPGAPNLNGDVIIFIAHNLHGVVMSGRVVDDAVAAGEDDLAEFFRQAQPRYHEQADRARRVLRQRLAGLGSPDRPPASGS